MGLGSVWIEDGELKMGNGYDQNRIQMDTSSAINPISPYDYYVNYNKNKGNRICKCISLNRNC